MRTQLLMEQLDSAFTEAGPINHMRCLKHSLETMQHQIMATSQPLFLDVFMSEKVASEKEHPFWSSVDGFGKTECCIDDFVLRYIRESSLRLRIMGEPVPGICIVVLDEALLSSKALLQTLQKNSPQYSLMLVLNYSGNNRAARNVKYDFFGKFIELEGTEPSFTMAGVLQQFITMEVKKLLQHRMALNTVQPLLQLSREVLQKENQLLSFQKNLNNLLGNDLRKKEYDGNVNEIAGMARSLIQAWSSEHERYIKLKYEELNKPNTGRYSLHTIEWSEELKDLRKQELAEKSEKWVTSIDNKFQEQFLLRIRKESVADLTNDYNVLLHSLDTLTGKIQDLLLQKSISITRSEWATHGIASFPNPEKSVASYIGFSRIYGGELIKKGAMEYFIALREYTGLIMVVAGLLAPLNMIASLSQNGIMKLLANGIRISTGVITLVMIVYGYFDLRKRIPRRRVEEQERELRRAKENLQQEGKKMLSDITRDWQGQVSSWMRDVSGSLQTLLEKELRNYTAKKTEELNLKKNNLQRNTQSMDTTSRRLTNAERTIDNCQRNHREQLAELEKSLKTAT